MEIKDVVYKVSNQCEYLVRSWFIDSISNKKSERRFSLLLGICQSSACDLPGGC